MPCAPRLDRACLSAGVEMDSRTETPPSPEHTAREPVNYLHKRLHCACFVYGNLKVLGKRVGLFKTSKRKDQLYISYLVSVWRIICENFNPNGLILAEI